ncbi:hypothetical protein HanPSC8_Chr13g0592321 [Helianthus annuus]|nr:hypothetical protein HanPSC8_Chr13g0592321 [Helianthus annuus]
MLRPQTDTSTTVQNSRHKHRDRKNFTGESELNLRRRLPENERTGGNREKKRIVVEKEGEQCISKKKPSSPATVKQPEIGESAGQVEDDCSAG